MRRCSLVHPEISVPESRLSPLLCVRIASSYSSFAVEDIMNNSDFGSALFCLFGLFFLAILGGLIALAVSLLKKSSNDAKQADLMYNRILQGLPQDKQMFFVMQYSSVKKNPTTAVLLALFLGGLGVHKFYMGQTGLGIIYLVFCWTYVPAIIGFIEAFVIARQVGKYNQQKAFEIATMLGGTNIGQPIPI